MTKHKESEGDLKAERKSAGVLLLLSRKATKDARKAASSAVDEGVAEAVRRGRQTQVSGPYYKAALFGALLLVSRSMSSALRESLAASRGRARSAGAKAAAEALRGLGVAVPRGFGEGAVGISDEAMAQAAADSVAASWRALSMSVVSRAIRREEDPARAVEATRKTLLGRAELAARTEASRAYNEEHIRAVRDAARGDEEFAEELRRRRVVRVWSSALEKNTCRACERHHGEVSDLDGEFDGGDEPGDMHPRCLCTSYLISEA